MEYSVTKKGEKSTTPEASFFLKINKIDKALARLLRKRRKEK